MSALSPVEVIARASAYAFVQEWHYSAVLPRLTKVCLGARLNGRLMAVCTLGWGVRPVHTIAKAFPGLGTADYLEIGKLCLHDDLPHNSESTFIAQVVKWCKRHLPHLQVLWTWADGIIGKPGYVYQASNFYYGGFIWTEVYLDGAGIKVHPRSVQGLSTVAGAGERNSRALAVTESMGLTKFWGKQFRYAYPLCGKRRWRELCEASPFDWQRGGYPKDADLEWEVQTLAGGRVKCERPPFTAGAYLRKPTAQLTLWDGSSMSAAPPCATCRHNAGDHCTREARGLTPYWWRWGGRLIEGCKPGRAGREVCPRYDRRGP